MNRELNTTAITAPSGELLYTHQVVSRFQMKKAMYEISQTFTAVRKPPASVIFFSAKKRGTKAVISNNGKPDAGQPAEKGRPEAMESRKGDTRFTPSISNEGTLWDGKKLWMS